MLVHNKDDIEFFTEFPCLLGHPVLFCLKNSENSKQILDFVSLLIWTFNQYDNTHV